MHTVFLRFVRSFIVTALTAALLVAAPACAQFRPFEPLNPAHAQSLALTPLEIQAGGKTFKFQVEVARTSREHEIGLMHRTELGADRGMLFVFKPPSITHFWMRNTFISLDMIFTDASGMIVAIARDVQPHDERPVGPDLPCAAVLEVNAGITAKLGINPGDRIRHASFDP